MEVTYKEKIHLYKDLLKKLILAYGKEQTIYSVFDTQNHFLAISLTTIDYYNKNKIIFYSSTLLDLYFYLAIEEYSEVNQLTIILLEYRNLYQISTLQISTQLNIPLQEYKKIESGLKKPTNNQYITIKNLLNINVNTLLKKEHYQ